MPATQAGTLQITAAAEREIVMTRVFDAPRALVFDAFTKPELIRRWLAGPPGWEMVVCDVDLQVGGSYRWFWRREKAARTGTCASTAARSSACTNSGALIAGAANDASWPCPRYWRQTSAAAVVGVL